MKYRLLFFMVMLSAPVFAQNLQLHYDPRHTLDPKHNAINFPTIYFEYFKSKDTSGSFFIKTESDLNGSDHNIGKVFTQMSQSFRFWKPKIYAQVHYSGGLCLAEPRSYGFFITNAFSVGPQYPFRWESAWFSTSLFFTYNAFKKPNHDLL